MKIDVYGISDVGMRREKNEDCQLINNDLGLFIVADGMGGHVGGEFASNLAVRTIEEVIKKIENNSETEILEKNEITPKDYVAQIQLSIREASHRIFEVAKKNPSLRGMGTTSVVLFVRRDRAYIANVGDSRAYLVRGNRIIQLTEDHSLVGEQLRAGAITELAAKGHKLKNIITRSVGFQEDVEIDVITKIPREGDKFLLCSDGLTNMVDDREIFEVVSENGPKEGCRILVDMANARGGEDNITVLLAEFTDIGDENIEKDDESTIGI